MNHWVNLVYLVSGILAIIASVIAFGRWLHKQIVDSVKEQIQPIDNAVNHRKPGEPRLVELIDLIWVETQRQSAEICEINAKVDHHLGWHEGQNSK
jgi:hypothetical protein